MGSTLYITQDNFNLGNWVSNQRLNKSKELLNQDQIERLEALPMWSWDPLAEQWEEAFEHLNLYVQNHGNPKVPRNYVTNSGFRLERWIRSQRENQSKKLLSQDKIDRLEVLPKWSWDPFAEQWDKMFELLQSYMMLNDNAIAPARYITPDGFNLGNWVSVQRKNKSDKLLSKNQIERLEDLSGWSWDPFAKQWEEKFEQLQSYVKQYGNARIPYDYVTVDDFNLGNWVSNQRRNESKNRLSQDQIKRLDELPGWVWSTREKN